MEGTKMFQPDNYRKFLLNRATASKSIIEGIENWLNTDEETTKHSFHKIMILHWTDDDVHLFDMISEYFGGTLIPVNYMSQNIISTFYTSNLALILKIIKLDFIFPYRRNMYNIDIIFNDKTSEECFETQITDEDIIVGVISRRFTENFELDLSNLINDPEFKQMQIHFYKLGLLAHFKMIMTRMGKHTKLLNLSNNNLIQVPQEILNFFIKGDLVAINLSNNNIPSITEMQRVNSRIEKLWLEGNPLCENLDATSYIKQIVQKFPRLTELDGIQFNQHGFMLPFYKNFLVTPDKKTILVVEKFINLYFAHYDENHRKPSKLLSFYHSDARFSISFNFTDAENSSLPKYLQHYNCKKPLVVEGIKEITTILKDLPETTHNLRSFCVDVLLHTPKHLLLVLDGVFKNIYNKKTRSNVKKYVSFRRTFLFTIDATKPQQLYSIINDMIYITSATQEQVQKFKVPNKGVNHLGLISPEPEDSEALCTAFMHLTQLNIVDAKERLRNCRWDIKRALCKFTIDLKRNKICLEKQIDVDDISDSSSLLEDAVD